MSNPIARYYKLYLLLAGAYVRSRLQYRLSFGLMCVAIVAGEACLIGLIGVLFAKFRTVNGWALPDIMFLYSLGTLSFGVMKMLGNQLDDFDRYVVRGDLDTVLIKPVPPLFYILASRVELQHAARLLTGIVIFLAAFHATQIRLTVIRGLFTIITVVSGSLIMFAFMLLSATVALLTTKSGKLTDILTTANKEAATFPISIYPLAVRLLLTFVLPVAFVTYYPSLHLLGKDQFLGMPKSFQFGAPVVAAALLLCCYSVWRIGMRHYHSTGS